MKRKENRFILSNTNTHVVHEGLHNYPDLRERLAGVISDLQADYDNTSSHLSDIGCHLRFTEDKLTALYKDIFERHNYEKVHGAPELTNTPSPTPH